MTDRRQRQSFKPAASAQATTQLMLDLWIKGIEAPLEISFPSFKEAQAFRLKMYRAIRPYRDLPDYPQGMPSKANLADQQRHQFEMDEYEKAMRIHKYIQQLEAIAKECGDGSGRMVVRTVEHNHDLARIAAQAGIPWGMTAEAEESQKRMMETLRGLNGNEPNKYQTGGRADDNPMRMTEADRAYEAEQLKLLQESNPYGDDDE